MEFDTLGNLKPYHVIETDWATFENVFITAFPESKTRSQLLTNFTEYNSSLKAVLKSSFYQWIDGSFITKKLNPKDIDFVTFVNCKDFETHQAEINKIRELRYDLKLGMDGYFVTVYPEDHRKHFLFQADKTQWLYHFGRSRTDKYKGFVQLNF